MKPRIFSLLAAAIALILLPACVEPPPGSESSIWQRPPRYGAGGTDSPKPPRNSERKPPGSERNSGDQTGGGRFGYAGSDVEPPADLEGDREVAPLDRDRDVVAADRPTDEPVVEEKVKKSGPPSVSEMPFAKGIPGKPLAVTLPAPHDKLGPVSIEQYDGDKPTGKPLPPGTPVEIADPGNPGKKIYFKVP